MSAWRHAVWLAPLVLGGCSAKLSSSLPAAAPPPSYVGAQAGAIDGAALAQALDQLENQLKPLAAGRSPVAAQLTRAGGGLWLRLDATQSFGATDAELEPAALVVYAELARIVGGRPGTIAHIVVRGDAALPSSDAALALPARRAASLQAYLAGRGVPGTRLRAEGRTDAEAETVEVLIKPIVAGRETEAWVPPS